MKRIIALAILLTITAIGAHAQTVTATQHGNFVSWNAGTCPTGQTCSTTANYVVSAATISTGPFITAATVAATANVTTACGSGTSPSFAAPCCPPGTTAPCIQYVATPTGQQDWYQIQGEDSGGHLSAAATPATGGVNLLNPTPATLPVVIAE